MQPLLAFPVSKGTLNSQAKSAGTGRDKVVDREDVMSDGLTNLASQRHSKRYFDASPTWFTWNKLTAADVHALRFEAGFEGQNIFFYLNHPIQYVRLVGLVVEIDIVPGGKYTLLTLDDGSGASITAKVTRRELAKDEDAVYPSNTEVDNVDVHIHLGIPTVYIDHKRIDIGSVVRAKGSISVFRGVRQMELRRIWIVKDTNEEAEAWTETAKWKFDVLSKPWVLTKAEREEIDERIREQKRRALAKARRNKEWNAKYAEKRRKHEEKHEAKRKVLEAALNAGALKESNVIAAPWD